MILFGHNGVSWNGRIKETDIKFLTPELVFRHSDMIPGVGVPLLPVQTQASTEHMTEMGLKPTLRTIHS